MKGEFRTLDTSKKQLQKFGLLVGGIILLIVGFLGLVLHRELHAVMPMIGVALVVLSLVAPRILLWPYYAWMGFAIIIGYFIGNILLIVLFYVFVTPIALLRSLFRKSETKSANSYWIKREKGWTKESMEQLF